MTEIITKKPAFRDAGKSKKGRKEIKITEDMLKEIEVLSGRGFTQEDVYTYFCISHATWYEKVKKHPELIESFRRGKSKALAYVTGKLFEAIARGDVSAIKYYLDRKGKWNPELLNGGRVIDAVPESQVDLKITVTDPVEASKIYQKIMTES